MSPYSIARYQEGLTLVNSDSRMEQYEYMEIWEVHPEDPHYAKNPTDFQWRMMQIKTFVNLCGTKDIYPEQYLDFVRWMLISYLIRENFERHEIPIPRFANGKRLHATGCFELYEEMKEKKDPAIQGWLELREDEDEILKMKRYLGLKHASMAKNGERRRALVHSKMGI